MSKQKIYISGPMTGYLDLNFPAFFEAEEIINRSGLDYEAVNPARLNEDIKGDWNACLRRDVKAEEIINRLGLDYEAINPARLNEDIKGDWNACLRRDVKAVCDCDGILLLDGWENSKGAQLELHVAKALGLDVYVFTKSIGKLNV